jgi:hypothetical protein
MVQAIAARAARRGFPVFDFAGQTGQGHLPDSTAPPATAGLPTAPWTDPNTDPGSVPAALPPPEEYVLGLTLWGLPAAANPDDTPRTHAAPLADPALLAAGEGTDLHAPAFTGAAERHHPGTQLAMRQGRVEGRGSSADTLQPLTGQIRSMGGYDAVQGYGGGGPGPGGVNEPQGPTTDQLAFGGETYHNVMVSAAEVPFLAPGGDQFIATPAGAPEFPPYAPSFDVPTASVRAQDVMAVDVPNQGPVVGAAAAVPAYATSFWG